MHKMEVSQKSMERSMLVITLLYISLIQKLVARRKKKTINLVRRYFKVIAGPQLWVAQDRKIWQNMGGAYTPQWVTVVGSYRQKINCPKGSVNNIFVHASTYSSDKYVCTAQVTVSNLAASHQRFESIDSLVAFVITS